jgi:hypothetical protein
MPRYTTRDFTTGRYHETERDELRCRRDEATRSTAKAEELRAMPAAERATWLATATEVEIDRAAQAFAAEDGKLTQWETYAARLRAKRAA